MANIKSAEKRIRRSVRQRERNRALRSRMRSAIKALREAVAAGDAKAAREMLPKAVAIVDSTARRGIIHSNTAARNKSRLTKAVSAI